MPWNKKDYPVSMKNLPEDVRNKAIEIGNALLEERDMDEGLAIATAISRAKDWAENRGKPSEARPGTSRTTDVKHHGEDRYVVPDKKGWAVKKEDSDRKEHFDTKAEAVKKGRREAKDENASLTVQRKDGRVQSHVSYNPNKRGPKQD
jgi:uncharacterized protein YdaT